MGVIATRAGAQEPAAIELITHNQIEIARPAEAIWPLILDPGSWKQGARLERRGGPAGAVGETFAALGPGGEPAFFVENVELVAARRRTIKLTQPDGRLIGFATWWLVPTPTGSLVGYDVYSASPLPPGSRLAREEIARQRAEAETANHQRFAAELATLKRLVESR